MKTAYLGLGSNLADRLGILRTAIDRLRRDSRIRIARVSSVYETKPVGVVDQPDFLNLVVAVETEHAPVELLAATQHIETALGRERRERWGPRTLDIDLLWYEGVQSDDESLTLPHPRLKERSFVLTPLAEIAPELRLDGERVATLSNRIGQHGLMRLGEWEGSPALAMKSSAVVIEELHGLPAPAEIFARVCERTGSFFLDSGLESGGLGRFSFVGFDPFLIFRAAGGEITLTSPAGREVFWGDPLVELKKLGEKYRVASEQNAFGIPFLGGMVGGFSYEFGASLERVVSRTSDDLRMPDAQFGFYDGVLVFDAKSRKAFAVANPVGPRSAQEILAALKQVTELPGKSSERGTVQDGLCPTQKEPQSNFSRDDYLRAVQRIKDYISAGDVYQVNLAQRFEGPLSDAPFALYKRLRALSPAPFASFFNLGDFQVVSSSPERFLRIHGRTIETRPIKGTRPRGKTPEDDARLRQELLASEKDRAELLMIVDLERNDLGRVSEFGSVKVDALFQLETHPTVFHLVSAVSGTLRAECDAWDCIRATFPGGSITGAPKIRAMQVIDELETRRRNWYTGAMGYVGFDGNCDFNIAIRTILCRDDRAYYHVGGGIVWDSDPAAEYQETLDKGRAMRAALMA